MDADGQSELVTIGDFQSHIDVLEFDPARPEAERLSVKWRRDIERNIEERENGNTIRVLDGDFSKT